MIKISKAGIRTHKFIAIWNNLEIMAKILFVNLEGKIAGAEKSLLLILKYLHEKHTISVACPADSDLSQKLLSMKVNIHKITNPIKHRYSSIRSLGYWLKTITRLLIIVKKENPDIIHANSFYAAFPSLFTAILTRKKLIFHARDLTNHNFLSRLYGVFCQKIIANSNTVKSDLVKMGLKHEKIQVIHNGIDRNESSSSISKDYQRDKFVFANIGQFVPWKNQIIFIKAAQDVARKLPNVRFVLIGDDIFGRNLKYKHFIMNYLHDLPLSDKFECWGWQENMQEVWSNIDCLVHTSEKEPFGRVIIEAMAHNKPVIAFNQYGPSEIIENGKNGILIPVGNNQQLSNAMIKIAENRNYAMELANCGYQNVISNFTANKTAYKIENIYKELLTIQE